MYPFPSPLIKSSQQFTLSQGRMLSDKNYLIAMNMLEDDNYIKPSQTEYLRLNYGLDNFRNPSGGRCVIAEITSFGHINKMYYTLASVSWQMQK